MATMLHLIQSPAARALLKPQVVLQPPPKKAVKTRQRGAASKRQAAIMSKEAKRYADREAAMEAAAAKLYKGGGRSKAKGCKGKAGPLQDTEQMRKSGKVKELPP